MKTNNTKTMKRFGVLSCNDLQIWGHSEEVIQRHIDYYKTNAQDEWVGFHACRGQVPRLEDNPKFDGLLITGSSSSVNDDEEWIRNLEDFIRRIAALETNRPKIVGLCFGHQLIAKALGGKVGVNPDHEFVLQTEELMPTIEAAENKSTANLFKNGPLRAAQLHGECVTELPKGAILLATSSSCKYEIIQFTDDMLGLQCHPNVDPEVAGGIALPYVSKDYNWDNEKIKKTKESLKMKCNHEELNGFIVKFLNRDE